MTHHDLLIIGTGSGNSILSEAYASMSVGIVERGPFGGTCLNVGCIPSKMFVYAADVAHLAKDVGPQLGVNTRFDGADWQSIRDRVFGRIDPIAEGGERYRSEEQEHVSVYRGSGKFVGEKTLEVALNDGGTAEVTADRIVLAAGARPTVPPVIADSGVPFHTSDTLMRVDELPEHLIVVGGGYIGAELGNVFGSLGSRVTIINRGDTMIRAQDPDIARLFTEAYASRFDVRTNTNITAVEGDENHVRVHVTANGVSEVIEGSTLFVATGRIPNGDQLAVTETGVDLDDRGYVVTDGTLKTSHPDIYALGDITNPAQLKHTANADARVVSHNLLNPNDPIEIDRTLTPAAIFGSPQVATVGLTQPQAEATGRPLSIAVQSYGSAAYGWAMEDTTSVCKLIADSETRELLGAHIIGPQASTLIQQLIQGMVFGQNVDEMARGQLYIHPALTEVVEQALLEL